MISLLMLLDLTDDTYILQYLSEVIDVVKDQLYGGDYVREEDPSIYVSKTTGRGPLSENWISEYWNAVKVK
jgi:Phosphatidylinositol transfer protein.